MSNNNSIDVCLALYSPSQDCFHIETLKENVKSNMENLLRGYISDYIPIFESVSEREVRDFVKVMKKLRDTKGSKVYFNKVA